MEVWLRPDGSRYFFGQPYIDQSELHRNLDLYNPYVAPTYGLYSRSQPACQDWKTHVWQYRKKNGDPVPSAYVTRQGQYERPFNPSGARFCN